MQSRWQALSFLFFDVIVDMQDYTPPFGACPKFGIDPALVRISRLKAQHNSAALGIIAAQAPQRIALYLYSREAVLNLDAKLQCKGWILTMSDPNAPALAAKPFHVVQHEFLGFPLPPAFPQHLKGTFRAGLPNGTDTQNAGHGGSQLVNPPILRKVVHGFQGKEQMSALAICLDVPAHIVEVGSGAHRRLRFFYEKRDLRPGRQGIHNTNTA